MKVRQYDTHVHSLFSHNYFLQNFLFPILFTVWLLLFNQTTQIQLLKFTFPFNPLDQNRACSTGQRSVQSTFENRTFGFRGTPKAKQSVYRRSDFGRSVRFMSFERSDFGVYSIKYTSIDRNPNVQTFQQSAVRFSNVK